MNNVIEYLPHGFCIAWNPQLLAMHVISDFLIAIAYFSIPIGILYVARKRPDTELQPIYYLFAAFILACGVTHVMGILTLWVPLYYTQGITKIVTALVSVATAIYLLPKLKHIMALPDLGKLTQINTALAQEIVSRRQSEASLRQSQELALQAQKTQAAFLANMSHEIRTPMNGVLGLVELLPRRVGIGAALGPQGFHTLADRRLGAVSRFGEALASMFGGVDEAALGVLGGALEGRLGLIDFVRRRRGGVGRHDRLQVRGRAGSGGPPGARGQPVNANREIEFHPSLTRR